MVMKSYFQFYSEMHGPSYKSIIDFCLSSKYGIPAWKKHVNTWLEGRTLAQRLHLIRYEDMLESPARELHAFFNNFGWKIDSSSIRKAVELSNIKSMKANEDCYRSRNPRYNQTFVDGSKKVTIPDTVTRYIEKECERELSLLRYI
jgi:hypothetical protein